MRQSGKGMQMCQCMGYDMRSVLLRTRRRN